MKHSGIPGRILSQLAVLMMGLLPVLSTLTPLPSHAADHPENWCADAVDLAGRKADG